MSSDPVRVRPRIPLTVIGGFLGAGKTTLLNHILAQAADRRWAVLVNDFGAINVDAQLIAAQDETLISLANGCVCCQIGDDLGDALMRVMALAPPPDHILIETSGISDPWRVAQVGLADPGLALDSVIVLVDATSALDQDGDALLRDMVRRQLAGADLLVVNHCDRVTPEEMDVLRLWLDHVARGTPRFETEHARVPAMLLHAPEPEGQGARAQQRLGPLGQGAPDASGAWADGEWPDRPAPAPASDDPAHGFVFESWRFDTPYPLRDAALRALVRAMPPGVLRLKGVVRTDRHERAVMQFAGKHGSLRPDASGAPVRIGRVVAIGLRGQLPREELEGALREAQAVGFTRVFHAGEEA